MRILLSLVLMAAFGTAAADSREHFVDTVLPKKYPQLISHLKDSGMLLVTWTSQTNEPQALTASLSPEGAVIIKTTGMVGPADNMNTPADITMIDDNQDARLDYIEYSIDGGNRHRFRNPEDKGSLFLWDATLAITVNLSSCCKK